MIGVDRMAGAPGQAPRGACPNANRAATDTVSLLVPSSQIGAPADTFVQYFRGLASGLITSVTSKTHGVFVQMSATFNSGSTVDPQGYSSGITLSGTITDFDNAGLFGLIFADEGSFFPFNLRETPLPLRGRFEVGTRVKFSTRRSGSTMRAIELVPIGTLEQQYVTRTAELFDPSESDLSNIHRRVV